MKKKNPAKSVPMNPLLVKLWYFIEGNRALDMLEIAADLILSFIAIKLNHLTFQELAAL